MLGCVPSGPGECMFDTSACTLPISFSTCMDLNVVGESYLLTSDIIDSSTNQCITISANDVSLDCQGFRIDGDSATSHGVWIDRASTEITNIHIDNCRISDWTSRGISVVKSYNNTFENVYITGTNTGVGIQLSLSSETNLTNVTVRFTSNGINSGDSFNNSFRNVTSSDSNVGLNLLRGGNNNFYIDSNFSDNKRDDITLISSNVSYCNQEFINVVGTGNKPIVFLNKTVNIQGWDNNFSQLSLCNADNSIVNDVTYYGGKFKTTGIFISVVNNSNFTNIRVNGAHYGLYIHNSSWNLFKNINISNNTFYGISLTAVGGNTLSGGYNRFNSIFINGSNWSGFRLGTKYNNLSNIKVINGNRSGLFIEGEYNIINDSYFGNNTQHELRLWSTRQGNVFYNNVFNTSKNDSWNVIKFPTSGDNYFNVTRQLGNRIFSSGTEFGGNYWTNVSAAGFSDICVDADTDGFCDLAYDIFTHASCIPGVTCGNNVDYLPLSDEFV